MALVTDIADAVVAELNANAFTQPLTAIRYYQPVFDLEDMDVLHVSVAPTDVTIESLDRGRTRREVQVDIAVQKRCEASDNATFDVLVGLVEEIADFFQLRRLAAMPEAAWVRTENVPVYSLDHLKRLNQFTSVLTLTFRVAR